MARLARTLGIAALAAALAACGSTASEEKKSEVDQVDETGGFNLAKLVGVTKNPPDEFAVISTRPLQMPDNFAALPAPTPGTRSPLSPDPVTEARNVLLGDSSAQAANARTSASESALISAAGADTQDASNIRTVLEAEQAEIDAEQDLYVLDNLIPALRILRAGENDSDLLVPMTELESLNGELAPAGAENARLATIPSQAPLATIPVAPSVPPAAARPTIDPVTGGELIYIPE